MNKLKERRKAAKMTQAQLSEKSGVDIRIVQALEQGYRDINKAAAATVRDLARAVGCTVEDLLD